MWYRRLNESIENRRAPEEFLIVCVAAGIAVTVIWYVMGHSLSVAASNGVVIGIGVAIGTALARPARARRRAERTQGE
jgi:Flp pilus assembly protein TadB